VDGDVLTCDVFDDPIICCRGSPGIVLGLEPVYRNYDIEIGQSRPGSREGAEGAGDYLDVDASVEQLRNH
jgi:hypothetical protein